MSTIIKLKKNIYQVCMRESAREIFMYQAEAIGFQILVAVRKVGQLQGSAWRWTDTCRFHIVSRSTSAKLFAHLASPLPPTGSDKRNSSS